MKLKSIIIMSAAILMAGCFDDKGNYDYIPTEQITVSNVPDIVEVLGSAENITIRPVISSGKNVITGGSTEYIFRYRMEVKSNSYDRLPGEDRWLTLNSGGEMDLDVPADFPPGNYYCYFSVTSTTTGVEHVYPFELRVSSTVYEGWMLWCNDPVRDRARLDMVSVISSDRIIPSYDVVTPLGGPELHGAESMGFAPTTQYGTTDDIVLLCREGGYRLDPETFVTGESSKIQNTDFVIAPPAEEVMLCFSPLYGPGLLSEVNAMGVFMVSSAGNAYFQIKNVAGPIFEDPINTTVSETAPEFRVAPFVGISRARPGNGNSALFYDTDNRRFVAWRFGTTDDSRRVIVPLNDPESPLFSFSTGMELVYMESTRYSGGLVYSILQDASGNRHIYGINMSGNGFTQESVYSNIDAPGFSTATCFAFHSQYPLMFYGAGNKVYMYNLARGESHLMNNVEISPTEEVTLLKFNLYEQPDFSNFVDTSDEFLSHQFELMVATYDTSSTGGNGGKLGFYTVNGTSGSLTLRAEYGGFARIMDVVYRERRKQ